jgi:nitrate/TMAO reductase-like tetraheme cytochrome c subunit
LILIISGAAWGSSQSDFCASCHEIQPDHTSWAASTHSKVACVDCHEAPGVFGRMASKALAIQNVSSHISSVFDYPINKNSELSKTIPSEQCTSCHNAPKAQEFGLLAFDHAKHTKTNCSYCHNRIAHEGYTTYTDRTEMESCLKCHETKKASVACITCHPSGVAAKPSTHLTGDWISTHKPMASAKCYTCLLYTSPSPRDRTRSRMPSSA